MIEERDLRPGTRMIRVKGQNIGIWEIVGITNGIVIARHVLKGITGNFSVAQITRYWRVKQKYQLGR